MGRIRAALLPPNNGMLSLPPLLPEAVASQARAAAAIFGLLALAWLLADLPLLWAFAAVAVGGAGLLLLRLPWLVWPGLAIALPFASGVEIGPLSMADGLLAAAVFLWFVDGVRKKPPAADDGLPAGPLRTLSAGAPALIPQCDQPTEGNRRGDQVGADAGGDSIDPGGAFAAASALVDLGAAGGRRSPGRDRSLSVRFPRRPAEFPAA